LAAATAIAEIRDADPDMSIRKHAAAICDRFGWLDEQGRISG
jgi:hypothetical protein